MAYLQYSYFSWLIGTINTPNNDRNLFLFSLTYYKYAYLRLEIGYFGLLYITALNKKNAENQKKIRIITHCPELKYCIILWKLQFLYNWRFTVIEAHILFWEWRRTD